MLAFAFFYGIIYKDHKKGSHYERNSYRYE